MLNQYTQFMLNLHVLSACLRDCIQVSTDIPSLICVLIFFHVFLLYDQLEHANPKGGGFLYGCSPSSHDLYSPDLSQPTDPLITQVFCCTL
jgi:hypothetical protein